MATRGGQAWQASFVPRTLPAATSTYRIPSPSQRLLRGPFTSSASSLSAPPPPTFCTTMAAPSWPGAEAYADRRARAVAIPLEQRSRDVRTFLEAHQLLDQAAAVLSSNDAPESERVVAILQCAVTAFSAVDLQPSNLSHPACLVALSSGHTLALMRPFVSGDIGMGFAVNDHLIQQVASPTASPVRSVQTIARLLLVAWVFTTRAAG